MANNFLFLWDYYKILQFCILQVSLENGDFPALARVIPADATNEIVNKVSRVYILATYIRHLYAPLICAAYMR